MRSSLTTFVKVMAFASIFFLAACGSSPYAVSPEEQVDAAQEQASAAQQSVVKSRASSLQMLAQTYYTLNEESMDGFATELESTDPNLIADATHFSDTQVAFLIGENLCLYTSFPDGTTEESTC